MATMQQAEELAELSFETLGVPAFSICSTAVATVMGDRSCGVGTTAVFVEVGRSRRVDRLA
jgi:hypothetical protein